VNKDHDLSLQRWKIIELGVVLLSANLAPSDNVIHCIMHVGSVRVHTSGFRVSGGATEIEEMDRSCFEQMKKDFVVVGYRTDMMSSNMAFIVKRLELPSDTNI
jgi:hypothetical protein